MSLETAALIGMGAVLLFGLLALLLAFNASHEQKSNHEQGRHA